MKDVYGRRAAREFAFQFLYQLQYQDLMAGQQTDPEKLNQNVFTQELSFLAHAFEETSSVEINSDSRKFALELLETIIPHHQEIPNLVKPYLQNWTWERLQKVDATILLLSVGEILFYKKTPLAVVIDEAIELAKKYGTKESSSFINALLDNLGKDA